MPESGFYSRRLTTPSQTLSIQAVVIILPTIGRDLGIPDSRYQWIVSSYTLTFGCFLLLWGRIGDIYGKRKVFIIGSLWVAATTACNPFIPNEIGFNIFRALQGLVCTALRLMTSLLFIPVAQ